MKKHCSGKEKTSGVLPWEMRAAGFSQGKRTQLGGKKKCKGEYLWSHWWTCTRNTSKQPIKNIECLTDSVYATSRFTLLKPRQMIAIHEPATSTKTCVFLLMPYYSVVSFPQKASPIYSLASPVIPTTWNAWSAHALTAALMRSSLPHIIQMIGPDGNNGERKMW